MAETTHTEWRRYRLSWTAESFHCLLFNSPALYYLQTPTWRYGHTSTPPQFLPISCDRDVSLPPSLEWHVWSSSSRNNCHAVHRSLSSGASVYECTMGILACPILLANFRQRDIPLITAIRMCPFLRKRLDPSTNVLDMTLNNQTARLQ